MLTKQFAVIQHFIKNDLDIESQVTLILLGIKDNNKKTAN